MCGIGLVHSLDRRPVDHIASALTGMNELLAHRGPDGSGIWVHPSRSVGMAHRRLAIIGLEHGAQPMSDRENWISYNGEVYNYLELRFELGLGAGTSSDTEVVLHAYRRWERGCLDRLRGMFAFALWDEERDRLVLARDRFGIKPLYYTVVDRVLYAASEAKALLPFLPEIATDPDGLRDYFTFQFPLAGKTLFRDIHELPAAHVLTVEGGELSVRRWWDVEYEPDLERSDGDLVGELREVVCDSVEMHMRSDVPVGAYVSGGLDSGIVAALGARSSTDPFLGFTGRFEEGPTYDESAYARELAEASSFELREITISPLDFVDSIGQIVYHLDFPVAGPGSFPQFMVSGLAAQERKVVLGGQGGDEIFGGYARYLLAYFEQCIKAAIEGTMDPTRFIVSYESIIPNLESLRAYKPMIREFWRSGLFGDLDERYFRLIDRMPALTGVVRTEILNEHYSPLETFLSIFRAENVGNESYFDRMTHFDFKTLLPALLQVEDRVSMAHGLESRTPLVDHRVVELAATLPALVKFKGGELKRSLKLALGDLLPTSVLMRKDKMGFPVPLNDWAPGPLSEFLHDTFSSTSAQRPYFDDGFRPTQMLGGESAFDRTLWGLLSLELWQRSYHDRQQHWDALRQKMHAPDDIVSSVVGTSGY